MHLVIDGFGGDPQKLQDAEGVRSFLDGFPGRIGMTKITEPHVLVYHGVKPEDWGVSGFVIIAESHISIHTFPYKGYVNIDIFSCKEFDHQRALDEMRSMLGLSDIKSWVLERGLEYLGPNHAQREVDFERRKLATSR